MCSGRKGTSSLTKNFFSSLKKSILRNARNLSQLNIHFLVCKRCWLKSTRLSIAIGHKTTMTTWTCLLNSTHTQFFLSSADDHFSSWNRFFGLNDHQFKGFQEAVFFFIWLFQDHVHSSWILKEMRLNFKFRSIICLAYLEHFVVL